MLMNSVCMFALLSVKIRRTLFVRARTGVNWFALLPPGDTLSQVVDCFLRGVVASSVCVYVSIVNLFPTTLDSES